MALRHKMIFHRSADTWNRSLVHGTGFYFFTFGSDGFTKTNWDCFLTLSSQTPNKSTTVLASSYPTAVVENLMCLVSDCVSCNLIALDAFVMIVFCCFFFKNVFALLCKTKCYVCLVSNSLDEWKRLPNDHCVLKTSDWECRFYSG